MMSDTDPPYFQVDLTNCDREPIHVLGNIQPFGFLVTVSADWLVSRVSANISAFTGHACTDILGRPLADLFRAEAIHNLRNRMTLLRGPDAVERLFAQTLVDGQPPFDVAIHMSGDAIVIEAEPATAEDIEVTGLVRSMIARLGQTESMSAFIREGARQVRAITGFDRVMVYRFDDQGSGEVVAEALRPGVDSFLGLHYPSSDIPAQARKLYLRNIFRIIADVQAPPVPVQPMLDPRGVALDQSLSVLRAVSPIHIEYLRNMGVEASLSISIIVNGRLWGLFACHHYAPRLPSFGARTAAELLGQMFSLMLESRERQESADYETRARGVTDRMIATIAQDSDLLNDANWLGEIIFDTIPADGIAAYVGGQTSFSGFTPPAAQFETLVGMLNRVASGEIFSTDCIQSILPDARDYADIAAGLIAIPLSRKPRDYVVLFRSEQLRSVRWAGNPEKAVEYGPNGARLTPRKSFEAWSELVAGRSLPFTPAEQRVAEALRVGMLEVLVRLSDTAGEERARAAEKQALLIAELNHRVRNILALIRGLISQTRDSADTLEGFVGNLEDRIQSLARAHDQITRERWTPARLIDLIETETSAYAGVDNARVILDGPNILIDPAAFTTLALVFHELVTNAAKYGALSDSGTVTVRWRQDQDGSLLIDWTESGGPPVTAPTRRGFGSTIIEKSVGHDLGGDAAVHYRLTGLQVELCVPSRYVAGIAPAEDVGARRAKAEPTQHHRPLEGKHVLLVEDSMIVALDGEDALRALGAERVITASTVKSAIATLSSQAVDFAVLDFNLSSENSTPVADALIKLGTPFVFASGYGEALDVERFQDVIVMSKPYSARELGDGVTRALERAAT